LSVRVIACSVVAKEAHETGAGSIRVGASWTLTLNYLTGNVTGAHVHLSQKGEAG
jgi:hypothetical protein